jgi:hypothetical protein
VIDSNRLERDASGKPLHTFPHPALDVARHDPYSKSLQLFEDDAFPLKDGTYLA